jgi:hypothetical protein
MFYSSELLSRNGKTPLARLWQMAHNVRVNKKVIEEFDIAGELPHARACLPAPAPPPRCTSAAVCLGHDSLSSAKRVTPSRQAARGATLMMRRG